MWQFLLLILILVVALLLLSGIKTSVVGGRDTTYAVVIICKMPIQVQEMRKKYIKHDNLPPHITLGYLSSGFDAKEVMGKLRKFKDKTIRFNHMKITTPFIALIPSDTSQLNELARSLGDDLQAGPRGGYHLSLAYREKGAPLAPVAAMFAQKEIQIPIDSKVSEIRISKRRPGEHWVKFKSVQF
jgi:2'-5' RNA ligase superfamily